MACNLWSDDIRYDGRFLKGIALKEPLIRHPDPIRSDRMLIGSIQNYPEDECSERRQVLEPDDEEMKVSAYH